MQTNSLEPTLKTTYRTSMSDVFVALGTLTLIVLVCLTAIQ